MIRDGGVVGRGPDWRALAKLEVGWTVDNLTRYDKVWYFGKD